MTELCLVLNASDIDINKLVALVHDYCVQLPV